MMQDERARETVHDELGTRTAGEHDAILAAIHRLERALAAAAPGREADWAQQVDTELHEVRTQLVRHQRSAEEADGLFAELERAAPQMAYRIGKLRAGHAAVIDELDGLRASIERFRRDGVGTFDAIRRRAAALLTELRAHQAEEVDLIFETFDRDIGAVD
jgi:hemerythrin-like domain-containing protein